MNLRRLLRERVIDPIRQARGSPVFVARGVALGTWIGLTPTMGVQMLLVAGLAIPLRASIPAAVALVWVSNPLTVVPLYFSFLWLGSILLGRDAGSLEAMEHRFVEPAQRLTGLGTDDLWPMVLGSLPIATVCAVAAYFVARRMVQRHRERLAGKREPVPVVQDETRT